MSSIKLYYFGPGGRAEVIRLLLAEAGVPYEDVHVAREQWPALKPTMPLGQMPVLEIDGVKFAQTAAIMRMLARKYGLNGSNEMETFLADQFVETVADVSAKAVPLLYNVPEDQKATSRAKFLAEVLPVWLPLLNKLVAGKQFVAGDKFTYADLYAVQILNFLFGHGFKAEVTAAAPDLVALYERVVARPNIASFLAARAAATTSAK